MDEHLFCGRGVNDDQIQNWDDGVGMGYDLRQLSQPVAGRPPIGQVAED